VPVARFFTLPARENCDSDTATARTSQQYTCTTTQRQDIR
jgi:hypothetical protein